MTVAGRRWLTYDRYGHPQIGRASWFERLVHRLTQGEWPMEIGPVESDMSHNGRPDDGQPDAQWPESDASG